LTHALPCGILANNRTASRLPQRTPGQDGSPRRNHYIEFVEALYARGFPPADVSPEHWRKAQRRGLPFNGEGLKLLMDEFVEIVQGSIRVMPCCFITGQAAGTAAALCRQNKVTPRELDAGLLRGVLREQGAYIP
jgi:hypothetical protein